MPPRRLLSDVELEQLTSWPPEVVHSDVVAFFTLGVDDLRWVRSHAGAANRLGLAVQVCGLRFLGFIPDDLTATPATVTERLAKRVGVAPSALGRYARETGERFAAGMSPGSSTEPAGGHVGEANGNNSPTGWRRAPWSTTPHRCCSARRSTIAGPNRSCGRAWSG